VPALSYISDLITIDCLEDSIFHINMAHLYSNCPICNTEIQDCTKEECDRCGWLLKIDNLLEPRLYDLLLDWSLKYYDRARELESRGKYRQDVLNNRLNTQRDDIDFLKQQISNISAHIPEIKSILISQQTKIDRDIDIPITSVNSTEIEDASIIEERDLEVPNNLDPLADSDDPILPDREDLNPEITPLSSAHQEIISEYYHNISQFATKYHPQTASLNKDSINSNRGNEDKTAVLEETNRGNYWVFNFNDITYLVPVAGKYINQHSYTTTTSIFESHNYTPDYKNIQLVKPAIVSIDPNTNPQTWRIQERGELVFL
jgi:hypothetical protein